VELDNSDSGLERVVAVWRAPTAICDAARVASMRVLVHICAV
jgi:hypothetical protein